MIVARAAPDTPILNTLIKIGSKIIFKTAPITIEIIANNDLPCATIYWLSPSDNITRGVPII